MSLEAVIILLVLLVLRDVVSWWLWKKKLNKALDTVVERDKERLNQAHQHGFDVGFDFADAAWTQSEFYREYRERLGR